MEPVRLPGHHRRPPLAERRIFEICDRFGEDRVIAVMRETLDRNKRAMSAIMHLVIGDNRWYFEDHVDDDGRGQGPCKIACALWREGDHVTFDFTGIDGGVFYRNAPSPSCLQLGNPLGAWPRGEAPRSEELVIIKQSPSAYLGTSLASTLTGSGIDTLVTAGSTTSVCVRATCVDAMSPGFIPIVARDAVGDRAAGPHEADLYDMNAKYADVMSEAETIATPPELAR